ncbi:hypothetical protein HG536_0H03260 [Torulaspora globosa]|uniref:Conserved oligomeric Golgi complex subunit 3 n=1 Tax=Torulaspora globosa TaxID=48254 RepID=A0A7G3ZN65_9SACH|nr:uncharacterized protein HG536_0H03260 [Torulaspora globosa]QLL34951.1 hypothetical protein HG536_0H03260 [Torulaspora globosa]
MVSCQTYSVDSVLMNRTRRSSIVSSIASRTGGLDYQELPQLLDDSYLLNKLEKLALVTEGGPREYKLTQSSEESATLDRYDRYNRYLQELNVKVEKYDTILRQVSKVQDHLEEAIDTFGQISSSSSDFIGRTRDTYVEYEQLSKLHRDIPRIMGYFTALDPIMRRLNYASSPNLVRKNSFNKMLDTIDQSLFFLEDHQDLAEAEIYSIRFKRCLIKACELIANYLSGMLRQTCSGINERLKSASSSSQISREALVYNKFEQLSQEYYTRIAELISRVHSVKHTKYHDELGAILNDCFENYFQTRTSLLTPIIRHYLDETFDGDKMNLVYFIQNSKTYFERLCSDEFALFTKFHGKEYTRERATQWLCQLCDPLYDSVRAKILRETDISMLCDSVTLFRQYYQFEDGSEEYRAQFPDVQFEKIFEPIVQKLQARLILRVQIYIQQHIVGYMPSKDSFIISRRRSRPNEEANVRETKTDPIVQAYLSNVTQHCADSDKASVVDKLELYYPPLITSLALLSKIYEMLNAAVFDDLAHHIVHDCILSLRKAYNTVKTSSGGSNNLDIKLSYLSNLLLLRQEIQNFNIQYTVNETYLDFSGVEAFFKTGGQSLRGQESSVIGMAKALVPRVVNNMVDARSELISELRTIIRDFTETASAQLFGAALDVDNCDSRSIVDNNYTLRSQLEEKLPRIHAQISTFIEDRDVVASLMDAIQEVAAQHYSEFFEKVSEEADKGVLNKSAISELMYDDVFIGFVNDIIGRLTRRRVEDNEGL